jgi:hypothetical protein
MPEEAAERARRHPSARRGPRRPWLDRKQMLLDELERLFVAEASRT